MKLFLATLAVLLLCTIPLNRPAAGDDLGGIQQEFEAGNYSAAISTLQALISQDSNDAPAQFWLGRCYFELRDFSRAIQHLEQAAKIVPGSSAYHQWLGRAYGEKADQDHSIFAAHRVKKELETAIRLDSSNIDARRDLEDYLLEAPWIVGGSKDDALDQVNAIAAIDPIQGHLARADYYSHLGNFDQASQEYNSMLELKPKDAKPYFEAAHYYARLGDATGVSNLVQAASEIVPKDPRLIFYRGVAAVLSGANLPVAEQELKSYIASAPEHSDWPPHARARFWLGQLYEKQGKKMEAAEQYRAAIQLNSSEKEAKKALEDLEKSVH